MSKVVIFYRFLILQEKMFQFKCKNYLITYILIRDTVTLCTLY